MRLYQMHKREFGLVLVTFIACFGLSVFIGLAGNLISRIIVIRYTGSVTQVLPLHPRRARASRR